MAERTRALGLKISDAAAADLDRVAELIHADKTSALEYALAFAARPAGPRVEAVLGKLDAERVRQALEVWGNQLARASEDNAKAFAPSEWCLIADVCNGTLWEPAIDNPAPLLAANVADGHALDGTGYKWLGGEGVELAGSLDRAGAGKPTREMGRVDAQVRALVGRLNNLDATHAWAVVHTVQFFWDHPGDTDARDPWWTLAHRRRLSRGED